MVKFEIENGNGEFTNLQSLTAVAFLGALCCAVFAIGIKWFRAQISFTGGDAEAPVQPKIGVYRSYGIDVYNPSYRVYDEASNSVSAPVKQKPRPMSTPNNVTNSVIDKQESQNEYSEIDSPNTTNANQNNNNDRPSNENDVKKKNAKKKNAKQKPKAKTKEEKAEEARLKKEQDEKIKQERLNKKLQDKELKEERARTEKETKAKMEQEKREKREREKKGAKGKKSKILATSSNMQNEAVNSPQNIAAVGIVETRPSAPMTTMATAPRPQAQKNPLVVPDNNYEPVSDFSSWDMVSAHRRDLRRGGEPSRPDDDATMAVNTLYMPAPIATTTMASAMAKAKTTVPQPQQRTTTARAENNVYSNVSDESDTEA